MKFWTLAILIFIFEASAFSQEVLNADKHIDTVDSTRHSCEKLNKKLLVSVNDVYYFKACSLHLINDSQIVNYFIQSHKKTPVRMTNEVFSALKIGKEYTIEDYYNDFPQKRDNFYIPICKKYNQQIISVNDSDYYYVDACKKRKFKNLYEVQKFNTSNNPYYAVTSYELSQLHEGKPMQVDIKNYEFDKTTEEELKAKLPKKEILCKGLNNKVAAFYEGFYFVQNCTLLPIKEFDIALQKKAQSLSGVVELTLEQALGIPEGKEISAKEVLNKLR